MAKQDRVMFKWLFGENPVEEVLMRDPQAIETIIWQHPSTEFNIHSRVNLGMNEVAVFYDMYTNESFVLDKSTEIKTNNIPVLSRFTKSLTGGVSKYQCKVYFIRTSPSRNIQWGTPRKLGPFYDKLHKGMTYSFTMNGIYSFQVTDPLKLVKLIDADRAIDFQTFEEERIFGDLISKLQSLINDVVNALGVDYIITKEYVLSCEKALAQDLQTLVLDEMGIKLHSFRISDVSLPDDPNDPYQKALASMTEEAAMVEGMGIQGIQNYILTHTIKIGEMAAMGNGTAGDVAGIGVGAGVGMSIGGHLGNFIQNTLTNLIPQGNAGGNLNGPGRPIDPIVPDPFGKHKTQPIETPQVCVGNNSQEDIAVRLAKLKEFYKRGIISEVQYNARVSEILSNI